MAGTDYSDHRLLIDSDTHPDEIREFVARRTRNPIHVDGVTIFNYSTHEIDWDELEQRVPNLYRDEYVIPFQLGPVWAYMVLVLPKRVREAELLRYDTEEEEYHPHKNFARISTYHNDTVLRKELAQWLMDDLDDYLDQYETDYEIHGDRDC